MAETILEKNSIEDSIPFHSYFSQSRRYNKGRGCTVYWSQPPGGSRDIFGDLLGALMFYVITCSSWFTTTVLVRPATTTDNDLGTKLNVEKRYSWDCEFLWFAIWHFKPARCEGFINRSTVCSAQATLSVIASLLPSQAILSVTPERNGGNLEPRLKFLYWQRQRKGSLEFLQVSKL